MRYKTSTTVLDKAIENKKQFAEKYAREHDIRKDIVEAVCEQIEACEELYKGLSEDKIIELLNLKTELQVELTCRDLKIA